MYVGNERDYAGPGHNASLSLVGVADSVVGITEANSHIRREGYERVPEIMRMNAGTSEQPPAYSNICLVMERRHPCISHHPSKTQTRAMKANSTGSGSSRVLS